MTVVGMILYQGLMALNLKKLMRYVQYVKNPRRSIRWKNWGIVGYKISLSKAKSNLKIKKLINIWYELPSVQSLDYFRSSWPFVFLIICDLKVAKFEVIFVSILISSSSSLIFCNNSIICSFCFIIVSSCSIPMNQIIVLIVH